MFLLGFKRAQKSGACDMVHQHKSLPRSLYRNVMSSEGWGVPVTNRLELYRMSERHSSFKRKRHSSFVPWVCRETLS